MKKCHLCEYSRTISNPSDLTNRLFTMICVKDLPNRTVLDIYKGQINTLEWEKQECVKGLEK